MEKSYYPKVRQLFTDMKLPGAIEVKEIPKGQQYFLLSKLEKNQRAILMSGISSHHIADDSQGSRYLDIVVSAQHYLVVCRGDEIYELHSKFIDWTKDRVMLSEMECLCKK